ncbi:MAG: hypothetical protein P0Y49_19190 [Candidatus Pedobacter colombiensis]|uniref:FAS1 domain-containing protein n=1 Tax=Candidatus Pedobacter colombiensis TaxID=3121371 RepID=A0AAJ6B6W7_9SPHI|nr:hypothetical protein [Pedobacter sp.]WEK18901.1 MAG: hypothetical protein P0Y49_19190 [Pedobacter sp.]
MKNFKLNIGKLVALLCLSSALFGCTLFGLDMQKDTNRVPHTIDPHINKSAWEFIKERATTGDKTFERLMAAIVYSEIDTMEYMKPNRTFILLNKDAVGKASVGVWPNFLVAAKTPTAWTAYPKEFVKNYLLYMIVDGIYDHYTLPPTESVKAQTLSPKGYWNTLPAGITLAGFAPNPESTIYFRIASISPGSQQDYPVVINDNTNYVRTSDIVATNGTIHVVEKFVTPVLPTILY